MKIRIDTYYDITCDNCSRSWSTDFNMGMALNKSALIKSAYRMGWKCQNNRTLCPDCVNHHTHTISLPERSIL